VTLVVDASAMVASLIDHGMDGEWARRELAGEDIAAPHLLHVEVANILRRAIRIGDISADAGTLAHVDLMALPMSLFPYEPFADRVWQLRDNLTTYDAWYVALAESIAAPLLTLDGRLARATGVRCPVRVPGSEPASRPEDQPLPRAASD
jgi:predicted nucleic acid-binding protein